MKSKFWIMVDVVIEILIVAWLIQAMCRGASVYAGLYGIVVGIAVMHRAWQLGKYLDRRDK